MERLRILIGDLAYQVSLRFRGRCSSLLVRIVFLTVTSLLLIAASKAQRPTDCGQVDELLRLRIVRVAARMLRTDPVLPTINQERIVPGSCYRQFQLSIPSANKHFNLYLSPDKHFLSATLWDVSVDPETVDMQMAAQMYQQSVALHAPSRGPDNAKVTMVIFSDFQCPYCSSFAETFEKYRKQDPAKVRLVFRNAPLPVHDWAAPAARAGICVSEQEAKVFWKFHDYLFFKQKSVTSESLPSVIKDFLSETPELNSENFSKCMASSFPQQRLEQDLADMHSLDIHSTPVVFVNGRRYEGFRDEASFLTAIGLAAESVAAKEEVHK